MWTATAVRGGGQPVLHVEYAARTRDFCATTLGLGFASMRNRPERVMILLSVERTSRVAHYPDTDQGFSLVTRRGRGWHRGQLYDDRFMNGSRRIGAPHRWQGSPSRP